jgi:hypothetical protein
MEHIYLFGRTKNYRNIGYEFIVCMSIYKQGDNLTFMNYQRISFLATTHKIESSIFVFMVSILCGRKLLGNIIVDFPPVD